MCSVTFDNWWLGAESVEQPWQLQKQQQPVEVEAGATVVNHLLAPVTSAVAVAVAVVVAHVRHMAAGITTTTPVAGTTTTEGVVVDVDVDVAVDVAETTAATASRQTMAADTTIATIALMKEACMLRMTH